MNQVFPTLLRDFSRTAGETSFFNELPNTNLMVQREFYNVQSCRKDHYINRVVFSVDGLLKEQLPLKIINRDVTSGFICRKRNGNIACGWIRKDGQPVRTCCFVCPRYIVVEFGKENIGVAGIFKGIGAEDDERAAEVAGQVKIAGGTVGHGIPLVIINSPGPDGP